MNHICFIYGLSVKDFTWVLLKSPMNYMNICARASTVMSRSINAQAEFWIKIGMQAEMNPDKTFTMLVSEMLEKESVSRKGEQHE